MNLYKLALAALLALLFAHDAFKPAHADYTVVCESRNGDYRFCDADTRRGVSLVNQLSGAGCWRGDTWGYNAHGIWVNNGCRGEFRVGGRDGSSGSDAAAAALAIGVIGAIIANSNDDRRDRDRDRYPDYGGGYDWTLRCESTDNRQRRCPADLRGRRVEVARQLSNSPCNFRYSWGYDRRGIWVDRGCRADFAVW